MNRRASLVLVGATIAVLVRVPNAQQRPTFSTEVEYIEVDARVLDAAGNPVSGLTQSDFRVFEDGVEHEIKTFSVVDLPPPSVDPAQPIPNAQQAWEGRDTATNVRPSNASRNYLMLLDDRFIAPIRTTAVRRLMRDFIQHHVGADDLVAVMSTGHSVAFQNFTSDKGLLVAALDRIIGEKDQSPTVERLTSIEYKASTSSVGGINPTSDPVAVPDKQQAQSQLSREQLVRVVRELSEMEGTSKAIIYISEGSQFDTLTNTEGLIEDARSAIGVAARGNVPIYPIDPRGLTQQAEESILVGTIHPIDLPLEPLRAELLRAQQRLRNLAEDTGGIATVSMNDFDGAFDRIVRQSSAFYALGYHPKNTRPDGRYRKITVRVDRPGVSVVARRGYTAPGRSNRSNPAPGPAGASSELRAALNSVLPRSQLGLSVHAAAFRDRSDRASVAVVVEANGADLALTERNARFVGPFEIVVAALTNEGVVRDGEARQMQFDLPRPTFERMQTHGFRWLSRLSLKPGRYQLRIAAISGAAKRGSVWYDLAVPDFGDGELAMSHILAASERAFLAPTFKPDPALGTALPGPPTTSRAFGIGDTIAVFVEIYDNRVAEAHDVDAALIVRDADNREILRRADSRSGAQLREAKGVYTFRSQLSFANAQPGRYVLTIEARRHDRPDVLVGRTISFEIVQ